MRKLIFEDTFITKNSLKNWRIREGNKWHNGELQAYTKDSFSVANGLKILGEHKACLGKDYVSGRLDTKEKFEFKYGLVEVVAKLPYSVGAWPAIWLLSSKYADQGWPKCGEIDIMESVGHKKEEVFFSVHTEKRNFMNGNGFTKTNSYQGIYNDYHKFSLDWTSSYLKWYVDDVLAFEVLKSDFDEGDWAFDSTFYLIINMAIGGNFTDNQVNSHEFPAEFNIKSVRVWGLDES